MFPTRITACLSHRLQALWLMLLCASASSAAPTLNPFETFVPPPVTELAQTFSLQSYRLAQRLFSERISVAGIMLQSPDLLRKLYGKRAYRPIWIQPEGINEQGQILFQVLRWAWREGLEPEDYYVSLISVCLNHLRTGTCEEADLELLLSEAYLRYSKHVRFGRLDPQQVIRDWHLKQDENWKALDMLEVALEQGRLSPFLHSLAPPHPQYQKLKNLLANYLRHQDNTLWPLFSGRKKIEPGQSHPTIGLLRTHLQETGDFQIKQCADRPEQLDPMLTEALRHFQARHGLQVDGQLGRDTRAMLNVGLEQRIGQIRLNMERWRWVPRQLGSRYIWVNIADFSLKVIENQEVTQQMSVIVGRKDRRTPVFSGKISYLVLNPTWSVPRSIALRDILPKARQDAEYLLRKGIQAFNGNHLVDAQTLQNALFQGNNFPYRLQQVAGNGNALGQVKFMFPNPFSIYLHDTPKRALFKKNQRTFSSGCIRLEKPLALANHLLGKNWNQKRLDIELQKGQTQEVKLQVPIAVYLTYWTAWVDEQDKVQFRKDVYNWDRRLARALQKLKHPDSRQLQRAMMAKLK